MARSTKSLFEDVIINLVEYQYPDDTFDNIKDKKGYTRDDREMMASILGLRKSKKNIRKKKKETTYILPDLAVISTGKVRTTTDHLLVQEGYAVKAELEFLCDDMTEFREREIKAERNEHIDVSDFTEQDMNVLDLINQVIASTDAKRDKAPKKTTNQKIKVAEGESNPFSFEHLPSRNKHHPGVMRIS